MIKAIFEVSRMALIAMTPTAIFFAACYFYRWRHGKKVPASENADYLSEAVNWPDDFHNPEIEIVTQGKPDRE